MKKLKAWQIVLLVIFYPVGICVLIYRLWKKSKLKAEQRAAEAARVAERERKAEADKARREREAAYRATVNRELFRVVGVTFSNDGGRSRQAILREIKREEPSEFAFSLREYDYEGEPAVGVFYNGEQVGNIAKGADLSRALEQIDRFDRVEAYEVTGGFKYDDDSGDRASYGLEIAVYFKKA